MSVEKVAFIPALREIGLEPTASAPVSKDFGTWLQQEVSTVNEQIAGADGQLRALALGEAENLHQVMMSLEKAKLSFELVLQVRNRLLEAYQDVMRMQV